MFFKKKSKRDKFEKTVLKNPYEDKHDLWETAEEEVPSDTLGSYTGVPFDDFIPEQDADDL